jgi:hypothetical protein
MLDAHADSGLEYEAPDNNTTDFEDIVDAVHALEQAMDDSDDLLFRIGEKLLDLCPLGEDEANNGMVKKLKRISAALKQAGCKHHSFDWLKLLRRVASRFPQGKRFPCVTWAIHLKAKQPHHLQEIIASAKPGEKITVGFVERYFQRLEDEREQSNKREAGLGDSRDPELIRTLYDIPRDAKDARERFKNFLQTLKKYPGQLTEQEVSDISTSLEDVVAELEGMISWVTEYGAASMQEAAE